MASLSTSKSGSRRILFTDAGGDRRTIHLGKVSDFAAGQIKRHMEAIVTAIGTAQLVGASEFGLVLDGPTARWCRDIPDKLHKKLVKVGLVSPRVPVEAAPTVGLGAFIDEYVAMRSDLKPGSIRSWQQARKVIVTHFGESRALTAITALDAKGFHAWLSSVTKTNKRTKVEKKRFSPASVSKHIGFASQFLQAAVDATHIPTNPFKGIKVGKRSNKSRQRFIDREMIDRVLEGCTDPEFRLVIALSRYGGLRIPSELDGLRWQDIDRQRGRILIHSPKTEHHEGGATREIPLFPELVPFIDEWYAACPEGQGEHVMASYRHAQSAWRTKFYKLLHTLGIKAWPRVFHNMRATRQTELEREYPTHVVCAWLGNSPDIARENYLQTTDEDFRCAARGKVAQISTRNGSEMDENTRNAEDESAECPEKCGVSNVSVNSTASRTGCRTSSSSCKASCG